jgi:hypothetical protein
VHQVETVHVSVEKFATLAAEEGGNAILPLRAKQIGCRRRNKRRIGHRGELLTEQRQLPRVLGARLPRRCGSMLPQQWQGQRRLGY